MSESYNEGNITLGELVEHLEALHPNVVWPFSLINPHSYRGWYGDIAFERGPASAVGLFIDGVREAVDSDKGGTYRMHSLTVVWIADEGCLGKPLVLRESVVFVPSSIMAMDVR